ncbi:MAG: hypothetical protein ABFR82_02630 [Nitrospirota bacterium]
MRGYYADENVVIDTVIMGPEGTNENIRGEETKNLVNSKSSKGADKGD